MSKVYVVTSGSYSDYHIDAIFSTKEQAEIYQAVHSMDYETDSFFSDYANYGIEEYEVDEPQIEVKGTIHYGIRIVFTNKRYYVEPFRALQPIESGRVETKNCITTKCLSFQLIKNGAKISVVPKMEENRYGYGCGV